MAEYQQPNKTTPLGVNLHGRWSRLPPLSTDVVLFDCDKRCIIPPQFLATVHLQSRETIRPIKPCLPAISIFCSPQWEWKWGEWEEESRTAADRTPNCLYSILTLIRQKYGEDSMREQRVDSQAFLLCFNVYHRSLSGRCET